MKVRRTIANRPRALTLAAIVLTAMVAGMIFSSPGHQARQAAHASDAPTIKSITFNTEIRPSSGNTYGLGDWIGVEVTFSEDVAVTGTPEIALNIGGTAKTAEFGNLHTNLASLATEEALRTRKATHHFGYFLEANLQDTDGVSIDANQLTLNGGTITNQTGTNAVLTHSAVADSSNHIVSTPDTIAPTVSSVEITSEPGSDSTYAIGDAIRITVTFSEQVTVDENRALLPTLDLDLEGTVHQATYNPNAGSSDTLVFTAHIEGETDDDGIAIGANTLAVNESSIRDAAGNDAVLTHAGLAEDADHKVDAQRPTISSASVSEDGTTVTVTLTEPVQISPLLESFIDTSGLSEQIFQFVVSVLNIEVHGAWPTQTAATVSGDTVTVTLRNAISSEENVKVRYDSVYSRNAPSILMDMAGNHMAFFAATAATNNSTVTERSGAGLVQLDTREITLQESDTTTYQVKLLRRPTAGVTVALTSNAPSNVQITPTSLTFGTENWNTYQTVTIATEPDDNDYGYWVTIKHTATRDDAADAESEYVGEDNLKVLMEE